MRILVTGKNGQLGARLVALLSSDGRLEVAATDRSSVDVTRPDPPMAMAGAFRPDWIVNCTAYTDVERAEIETEKAFLVNDAAVGHLADAAHRVGARLLHVSTDYVFSGDFGGDPCRPYTEADLPRPLNQYGASKLAGELRLASHPARSIVLRTSWLHGGAGKSFPRTMLRLAAESSRTGRPVRVVADQLGTPTDVGSLATRIRKLLDTDLSGLFHASCQGETSWFEFAREIFRAAGLDVPLEAIRTCDYPTKARRPPYSVLENRGLQAAGLDAMPHWLEGLRRSRTQ